MVVAVASVSLTFAILSASKRVSAAIDRHAVSFAGFWGQDSAESNTQFIPWEAEFPGEDAELSLEFTDIVEGGE